MNSSSFPLPVADGVRAGSGGACMSGVRRDSQPFGLMTMNGPAYWYNGDRRGTVMSRLVSQLFDIAFNNTITVYTSFSVSSFTDCDRGRISRKPNKLQRNTSQTEDGFPDVKINVQRYFHISKWCDETEKNIKEYFKILTENPFALFITHFDSVLAKFFVTQSYSLLTTASVRCLSSFPWLSGSSCLNPTLLR